MEVSISPISARDRFKNVSRAGAKCLVERLSRG